MKLSKQRLEAFSDGIIAIIITIMVLSIPLPTTFDVNSIMQLLESFFIYLISFIVVGSFWSQHHRIFLFIKEIKNSIIWMNLMFLFFLSLIPILTKWVIENPRHLTPVIGYDITYLLVYISYALIMRSVIRHSKHKQIKSLLEERKDFQSETPPPFSLLRFLFPIFFVVGIILLSKYYPRICTLILLGLPVIFSIANLLFDDYKQRASEKQQRKAS